ncbi:MAG TPA: FAD:protein FMN transferase [Terriglobia bacterium]|nr:FAD:protein FMN transferase [Terriglobia bacterium]
MGTVVRIVLFAVDAHTASAASDAAFARVAALDDIMSDYKLTSELTHLSEGAGGPAVEVSGDLYRVLAAGEDLARRSDGAFDITVGPVVQLWRRARRRHELPDPERLARAVARVGYDKLRLDPVARTAELTQPGMQLDLGGIAKGYAADEALGVLKRLGISCALVAAAGDIAAGAAPPGRAGWRIEIAPLGDPAEGAAQADGPWSKPRSRTEKRISDARFRILHTARYLQLHDAGISTSGDAEQHVEVGGVRYAHIVDPRTGQALTGHFEVTVLAPNDFIADGLATAVSVMGPQRGLEVIRATAGAGVLFLQETADGVRSWSWRFPELSN